MSRTRLLLNIATFVTISSVLLYFGITEYLFPPESGRLVMMETANSSGLLPRSDVTVRGVPSGAVSQVRMTDQGTTLVTLELDPGVTVTRGTTAEITRRSPIGDITVNLIPGEGATMPTGGRIPMADVTLPPEAERTIEVLAQVLSAVPPENLTTVVTEAATALRGRGQDLATLSVAGADLPQRILEVKAQLESLIRTGPDVLEVLAENAPTLADDITETAVLAEILAENRFELVDLSKNGGRLTEVLGDLLARQKPNLACMLADFGNINATLSRGDHLKNLQEVLDLNHFFFDGVDLSVQKGKDGYGWFRVHLLPPQQPPGAPNAPHRLRPDVFGGDACRNRYGEGVGAPTQPTPPYVAPGSKLHPGQ